jgi:hypothetical protein
LWRSNGEAASPFSCLGLRCKYRPRNVHSSNRFWRPLGIFDPSIFEGFCGCGGTFLLLFLADALSGGRSGELSELSPRKVIYAVGALLAIAVVSYGLKLEQNAAMLLLLMTVLTTTKLEGMANGMLPPVISAVMLTSFFLPRSEV